MEHNFNKRYVGRFVGFTLLLFVVLAFLPLPGAINALAAGGVAFYIGRVFAKDNARLPTAPEQNGFALKGFLVLAGITLSLTGIVYLGLPEADQAAFAQPFQDAPFFAIIIGSVIAVLMLWGCIHFGFGLGARFYLKKLSKGTA